MSATAIESRQRAWALGLLLVIYVFNFIDRSILSILLQPIKAEFHPSDTALGLLSGIAFAVIYSTLGIPIALLADRGSRKTIVSLSLFVWSAMTVLCGLATSFTQLFLARIGVGVGEAGCSPPAHSMIADYFPPERRASAFGIYSLGIPIGGAFGVFAGGWINEWFDWRTAFLVVGLPGVALAIISQLTMREPPRIAHASDPPSATLVARHLWALRSFRHLALAGSLHALVGIGVSTWSAAFLMRMHGMGTGEAGSWLAGIALVAGGLGTYFGGVFADRLGRRDARWNLWLPGIAILVAAPFSVGFYLLPNTLAALSCAAPATLLGATYLAPTFATTQALATPRMRAAASAVLLFFLNLIGMGLGPLAVGVASDFLARTAGLGDASLRWALLLVTLVNLWSAVHYFLGARTLRADIAQGGSP
jgi:MFS family permease